MKLRIRGDSIRLRVTRPELAKMQSSSEVSDAIHFGANSKVVYRLVATSDVTSPEATFDSGTFLVRLPQSTFDHWANSDEISIHGEQKFDSSASLAILIEKDFTCLQPREGEDDSEMFANPDAGKAEC